MDDLVLDDLEPQWQGDWLTGIKEMPDDEGQVFDLPGMLLASRETGQS